MAEKRVKVEFIESYMKVGNTDYEWCDNHGQLVRCGDCKFYDAKLSYCPKFGKIVPNEDFYCGYAVKKGE